MSISLSPQFLKCVNRSPGVPKTYLGGGIFVPPFTEKVIIISATLEYLDKITQNLQSSA